MNETEISIGTICGGTVPEIFDRELAELLKNVHDPNTVAEKARTLTLKFTFKPSEDRSLTTVDFSCRSALQPVKVVKGQMFLSRHTGVLKAYAVDHRQVALFPGEERW